MADLERLRALLDAPDAAWIIERLRTRVARGAPLAGTIALRDPTDAQRTAVARLFGHRTSAARTLTVGLGELEALLRHGEICDSLEQAVTLLVGPVANHREARDAIETQWADVFDRAAALAAERPHLDRWLADVRSTGLLRRMAGGDPEGGRTLIELVFALAGRLPARGLALAELAANVAGDSHALDAGEPLGTLAIRLAAIAGTASGDTTETARPRDVWASVGVLCDELSAPVLVLNLVASTGTPTGRALAVHAEAGEPYRLSVRQLLREPPEFRPMLGSVIHVCENPTVVGAAANHLGADSAPLVCVEGQPRTGVRLLLAQLTGAGARLVYHGDFDWGGIRIGNVVIGEHGARPWRFATGDYQATRGGRPLSGLPVTASWDESLAGAMIAAGRAVHEEHVMNDLISDLAGR